MDNQYFLKKQDKEHGLVWFCGCVIEGDPHHSFEMNSQHISSFDWERLSQIYVCHENKKIFIDKYI